MNSQFLSNYTIGALRMEVNTFFSNHFHSVKFFLFPSARSRDFNGM